MSPQLYAFIMGSTGGVSSLAILRWAERHRLNGRSQVTACYRAVDRGLLAQRAGTPYARVGRPVIFYVPPVWHREQAG